MAAGVVPVVAAAHDPERRGHGALARGQDRAHQQHLCFPPSRPAEQRCEGNEDGYNSIGQGERGWAFSDTWVGPAYPPRDTGPNTSRLFSPLEFRNFLPAGWTKAATAARPQVLKSPPTLATKN